MVVNQMTARKTLGGSRWTRRRWFGAALAAGLAAMASSRLCGGLARAQTPVAPESPEALLAVLRPDHPRLILTSDALDALRSQIVSDPVLQRYVDSVRRRGEQVLTQAPVERRLIGPRLLDVSRRVLDRVYTLALLFRLDADSRWLNRARDELVAVAQFSDWNPSHFLDVAEMSHAFAIGYDWLYDALSSDEQSTVRGALIDKGLRAAQDAYASNNGRGAWWATDRFNWNLVCNGGMLTAALAVADEAPELCADVIKHALAGLPRALGTYAPDGAWPEGPGYWSYATQYATLAFATLNSSLGGDFGITELPGLADTGGFIVHSIGPTGLTFNFADAGERLGDLPSLFWLARRYDAPVLALDARAAAERSRSAADVIHYTAIGTPEDLDSLGLDRRYTAANVAFLRSSWSDPAAVYVGFKGGDNAVNHAHLDLGTFVLDAQGQRWAVDLGPDDYDLPEYFGKLRWTYYRLRTEGHNTLVLNGQNQDARAVAPLVNVQSASDAALVVADLTNAYAPASARRVLRGVMLLNGRKQVLVQDEIDADPPADITWTMHTRASATVAGAQAVLQQADRQLRVRVLEPLDAVLRVDDVNLAPPQKPTTGVRKLVLQPPSPLKTTRIAVLFTPEGVVGPDVQLTPLAEWRV